MRWVKDQTGRFSKRPHYAPDELDHECERLISSFLKDRHGSVAYPVSTDDLTILVESLADDLDLYADLSGDDGEVEGVTDFVPGRRPKVRISKRLSENANMANRLRTTLTHELGHVHLHSPLFDVEQTGDLFVTSPVPESRKCQRATIVQASRTDWMEWQAGYACGAFLMPVTALRAAIRDFMLAQRVAIGRFGSISTKGHALITEVGRTFHVSRDAARVRLLVQGALVNSDLGSGLI